MSWILTVVSIVFIAWAWAIEWNYIRMNGSGDNAMGRGLAVAFLGLIGIVIAIVAFVVGLFTQDGVPARLVPLTPFLVLLGIWVQSRMFHAAVARREAERPRPWLVIDRDANRRAAMAAELRKLNGHYVVTEIAVLAAVAGLGESVLDGFEGMIIPASEITGIDPDNPDDQRASLLRRIDCMTSAFVFGPEQAAVEDACNIMTRRGTLVSRAINSTDPKEIGRQIRVYLGR